MKKNISILLLSLMFGAVSFAQTKIVKPIKVKTDVSSEKHLSSSILLWMRTDTTRQAGMNRWKGPHSKIIAANKGLWEYRQIHLNEKNTGMWPTISSVETTIPQDRKIDGIADVTLKGFLSLLSGREQNKLAYKDEVNLFKRTILYAAFPNNSRWYYVADAGTTIEARSIVLFRKKDGVKEDDFKKVIMEELTPMLANTGLLKELRSKTYNPWKESQWDTPNVLHDNAKEVQFQASIIIGFSDKNGMAQFFKSEALKNLSERISLFCTAVHAYEIEETLTFVKEGKLFY